MITEEQDYLLSSANVIADHAHDSISDATETNSDAQITARALLSLAYSARELCSLVRVIALSLANKP